MKTIHEWFDKYGESHQNPTNKAIHWVCVPVIFFSIVALISQIPAPWLKSAAPPALEPYAHWATPLLLLVLIFYLRLSPKLAVGIALFAALCLWLITVMEAAGLHVTYTALILFTLAWIGQFYGHKVEGKKPSFFEDVQFLLIGPAWLLGFVYRKMGVGF